VTFTDNSTYLPPNAITSWSWSFPGGTPSSSTSQTPPPVTYSTSGSHPVTLTVTNGNGCQVALTQNVNTLPPPSASFTLPSTVCRGMSIAISGTGGGIVSWNWDFGDTTTSNLANTSHAWTTPGPKIVTLVVVDAAGCSTTVTQPITVVAPATGC